MSIMAMAYYSKKSSFEQPFTLSYSYWSDSNTQDWSREKIMGNWQKASLVSNTNLRYCLISEQILAQQASWYTGNPATTLLIHLLPQHGTNHGYFAKIWEQTLPWLNQKRKTNLFTTCWEILATTTMDGLGCIGKLIKNFIGLIAALWREILRNGAEENQKKEKMRNVYILWESEMVANGITEIALTQAPLPSASGQFRRE